MIMKKLQVKPQTRWAVAYQWQVRLAPNCLACLSKCNLYSWQLQLDLEEEYHYSSSDHDFDDDYKPASDTEVTSDEVEQFWLDFFLLLLKSLRVWEIEKIFGRQKKY